MTEISYLKQLKEEFPQLESNNAFIDEMKKIDCDHFSCFCNSMNCKFQEFDNIKFQYCPIIDLDLTKQNFTLFLSFMKEENRFAIDNPYSYSMGYIRIRGKCYRIGKEAEHHYWITNDERRRVLREIEHSGECLLQKRLG